MTNWKKFKIINWKTEEKYCTTFCLDGKVYYKRGNTNAIFCSKPNSFSAGWKIGDYLEVDLDGLICRHVSNYLEDKDTNIVRKVSSTNYIDDLKQSIITMQIESISLSGANNSLSKALNNFYKQITEGDEDFVSHYFHPTDLSDCMRNLNGLVDKFSELKKSKRENDEWKNKHDALNDEVNRLKREIRELRAEKEDYKEKYETEQRERQNEKTEYNRKELEWEREKREKDIKTARLEEGLNNSNSQKTKLEKELESTKKDRDNQVGRLEIKLDEKTEMIKGLNNQLTNLDNELKKKDEKIEHLKKWAELSHEELLTEKLRSEKENLEFFATELKINLEQIQVLIKYHERLFQARKKHNQANIETHDSNIAQRRQELLEKKISIVNIQEICRKCQRMAELSFELEQTQQKQIRVNEWKNINSNFTAELIQEWTNHGFTYEQCREWINTNSPWQQNRAIKEPAYYAWLRDFKKVNVEWVLNHGDEKELSQEFFQWYQEQYQAQQEQPTK